MWERIGPVLALALALLAAPAYAQEDGQVGVVEGERGSLESFFYSVWSRLSSLAPRAEDARVREGVVATAGLRGADGDNLEMEPYWKGDLGEDPEFTRQIEAYRSAIERGRGGDQQALKDFLDQHGNSDLAANVRFALAVSQARAGDRDAARSELQRFIDRYPRHPLTADARNLLQRLGS